MKMKWIQPKSTRATIQVLDLHCTVMKTLIGKSYIKGKKYIFTLDSCIKDLFTLGLHLHQHHSETSSLTLCQWRQKHKYTKWSEPILDVFH